MPSSDSAVSRNVVIAIAALAVFLGLAATITRTQGPVLFDAAVRDSVHALATPLLTSLMKVVTNFGSAWYLLPVAAVVALCLRMENRRSQTMFFAAAVAGAYLFENGLKLVIHRARPEPFFGYAKPPTYSFPSGHAVLSLSFYIALTSVLIAPQWSKSRKAAAWSAAILLMLAVGLSRIYLGVHYPTDVLGGYLVAIAWIAGVHACLKWRGGLQTDAPPGQSPQ